MKLLSEEEAAETKSSVVPQGISQREAWVEFLSAYGESYPNMATITRVMLVQLTNSADAERYFSWHKELIGTRRHNIDTESTLQALSVIKYNSVQNTLQNNVIPETLKVFEKSYTRNYKCSSFRIN